MIIIYKNRIMLYIYKTYDCYIYIKHTIMLYIYLTYLCMINASCCDFQKLTKNSPSTLFYVLMSCPSTGDPRDH